MSLYWSYRQETLLKTSFSVRNEQKMMKNDDFGYRQKSMYYSCFFTYSTMIRLIMAGMPPMNVLDNSTYHGAVHIGRSGASNGVALCFRVSDNNDLGRLNSVPCQCPKRWLWAPPVTYDGWSWCLPARSMNGAGQRRRSERHPPFSLIDRDFPRSSGWPITDEKKTGVWALGPHTWTIWTDL